MRTQPTAASRFKSAVEPSADQPMGWFGDHMGPLARSPQAVAVGKQTRRVAAIGLVAVMASGAIWLLLQTASMSGLPFNEAVTADVLSTVVTGTQFGLAQDVRFALALILAGCLSYDHVAPSRWLGLLSALGLIAAIA